LNEPFHEFAAAWLAVAYRHLDVLHYGESFNESLVRFGSGPAMPERYAQERYLFCFFVSGLSAIESFCYGLCAIAWEAAPQKVSLATLGQRKGISPESTAERFRARFPNEAITASVSNLVGSSEYASWVDLRNALAHRTSPPRKHFMHAGSARGEAEQPSEWGSLILDAGLTASRRDWLCDALAELLGGAGLFAAAHF
jgi:hypothetical protein